MRYLTYHGRADRTEFLATFVFAAAMFIGVAAASQMVGYPRGHAFDVSLISVGLLTFALVLLAAVRRLHDLDKNGQWILIFAGIPMGLELVHNQLADRGYGVPASVFIEAGILIWAVNVLVFTKGTEGSNRFGSDPLRA